MSDVGQNYHSDHYKCPVEEGHVTKIRHDNYGIEHTFMEVDNGAPIQWSKQPQPGEATPKPVEATIEDKPEPSIDQRLGEGKAQKSVRSDSVCESDSAEGGGTPQTQDKSSSSEEDKSSSSENEDQKPENDSKVEVFHQQATPPPPPPPPPIDLFEGRDVCTEQLELLIDDIFDGEDSNKSFLAYCLDAQRNQWELSISRSCM